MLGEEREEGVGVLGGEKGEEKAAGVNAGQGKKGGLSTIKRRLSSAIGALGKKKGAMLLLSENGRKEKGKTHDAAPSRRGQAGEGRTRRAGRVIS